MAITFDRFLLSQPRYPDVTSTDKYYFNLCNRLIQITEESKLLSDYHPSIIERAMLVLIGYFQDMMCDAGLWHAFIDENRRLYGKPLPFYPVSDEYMDYELNPEDVRFIVWYATSMYSDKHRYASPDDAKLMELATILYDKLEQVYETSPMPEDYCFGRELEMHDPLDKDTIMELGHWLFLHSWLLTPAYALTLADILNEAKEKNDDAEEIQRLLHKSMNNDCTGPLALILHEWVYLVVEGKMPPLRRKKSTDAVEDHKYYTAFTRATGGDTIAFFKDYEQLNTFLIKGMGWADGQRHLEQIAEAEYFTLSVDREKGLMIAPYTAQCIASPSNPYYDCEYARDHSFEFLSVRGRCPIDLVKKCLENDWLPDAVFPGSDNKALVRDNADFIARCYLQGYYRAD